jgi:hypothetical protein
MKKAVIVFVSLLSLAAHALNAPRLCSAKDLKVMGAIWKDMDITGFDKARYQQGIGVRGGDCDQAYTLEKSAGFPHKSDAPMPTCGIVFILDSERESDQAAWILNSVGSTYRTQAGLSMRLCSEISAPGPHPGVTVHN